MPKEFRFKGEYIVITNSYEVDGSLSFRKSVKFSPYVQVLERQRRIRYVTIRIRISLFILIRIWSWISTGLSSNGNFFLHKIQTCPLIHPDCKILGWTGSMLFNHPVPRIYSSDYAARISDPDPAKHGPNPKPWLDGDEIRRDSYNIKRFEPQERQSQLNSVKC